MGNKIGRNDPCWCGSGLKYKNCHLKREKQQPLEFEEIRKTEKRAFGKEYCLHSHASPASCKGGIVKAHTIQRNGGLSSIAQNGHVYTFSPNTLAPFVSLKDTEGNFEPKLVGINSASTFTGFCAFHDDSTFAPIEKQPFENTAHHALLLGFRTICHEIFKKQAINTLMPMYLSLDRGKPIEEQKSLQEAFNLFGLGVDNGLRDLKHLKAGFDAMLISGDYSNIGYYIVRFKNPLEVLVSGGYFPTYDFQGKKLQSLEDLESISDGLNFSLIATDDGGAAVFTWLKTALASERFVHSVHVLKDNQIANAIIRFIFSTFENMYLSPLWWDNLSTNARNNLTTRFTDSINPEYYLNPRYLFDDGLQTVNWTVYSRHTNLPLNR